MTTRGLLASWLALLLSLVGACGPSSGDVSVEAGEGASPDVRVVTSGGFAAAYDVLAPRFEEDTGIRLVTAQGASSGGAPDSIPVRLDRGESFDVVILSRPALETLAERGFVQPDSRVDLARSSIGMAVRAGVPVPDISTPETFIATLLEAGSIGYSASVSGTYLSTVLFPRLGLADQLDPKSRRVVGERVGSVVARGEVDIGFQQISELLPIDGIAFAGPIPAEYQRVTTFSAGVTTGALHPTDAARLIAFLASPEARSTLTRTGLEPPKLDD